MRNRFRGGDTRHTGPKLAQLTTAACSSVLHHQWSRRRKPSLWPSLHVCHPRQRSSHVHCYRTLYRWLCRNYRGNLAYSMSVQSPTCVGKGNEFFRRPAQWQWPSHCLGLGKRCSEGRMVSKTSSNYCPHHSSRTKMSCRSCCERASMPAASPNEKNRTSSSGLESLPYRRALVCYSRALRQWRTN